MAFALPVPELAKPVAGIEAQEEGRAREEARTRVAGLGAWIDAEAVARAVAGVARKL
jgi:hypothetical protein